MNEYEKPGAISNKKRGAMKRLCIILMLLGVADVAHAQNTKPNIVLILADNLGYDTSPKSR